MNVLLHNETSDERWCESPTKNQLSQTRTTYPAIPYLVKDFIYLNIKYDKLTDKYTDLLF